MMDKIYLGSSPYGENCAQVGTEGYYEKAMRECEAYLKQLRRHYKQENDEELPSGVILKIKSSAHDFGSYYEVIALFHTSDEAALEAAFWLENNSPEYWDEKARIELGLFV